MHVSLADALLIDAVVVLGSACMLLRSEYLRHSHPGLVYLVFHLAVFTYRGWSISGGASTFLGLTHTQVTAALLAADLFLVCATLGWLLPPPHRWVQGKSSTTQVRPSVVIGVTMVAMPIGLFFLGTRTYAPGSGAAPIEFSTSYEIVAVTWPGLLLLGLIYVRGFRWYLLVPLMAYLAFMGVQGQGRYRFVLPLILLVMIWLDQKGKKLPSRKIVVGLVAVLPFFVAMDSIGAAYRSGSLSPETFGAAISDGTSAALSGETHDQHGLDSLGVAMAQSARHGEALYGTHYINVLFLPVPRPLWAEKPVLNEQIVELSTVDRPLSKIGAVFTLPGSLYVDFRWVGITLGAFLLARLGFWVYCRAYAHGMGSALHFGYLLFAASLIQVYRDSLMSIVTFLLVKSAPLVAIVVLTKVLKPPKETCNARQGTSANSSHFEREG